LSSVAAARGAQVVWGRCSSDGGAPAYWPWDPDPARAYRRRRPTGIASDLGARADDVAQLLPELRDHFPELDPGAREAEDARFRLFDATATFLIRAAAEQPLVWSSTTSMPRHVDACPCSGSSHARNRRADPDRGDVSRRADGARRGLSESLSETRQDDGTACQLVLTGLSE